MLNVEEGKIGKDNKRRQRDGQEKITENWISIFDKNLFVYSSSPLYDLPHSNLTSLGYLNYFKMFKHKTQMEFFKTFFCLFFKLCLELNWAFVHNLEEETSL